MDTGPKMRDMHIIRQKHNQVDKEAADNFNDTDSIKTLNYDSQMTEDNFLMFDK